MDTKNFLGTDFELDPVSCRRARLAKDSRFDGLFFAAATSTGIYCRPVCPAVPVNECNEIYFKSAAQAEAAGFRPCLRCRPETAPGSPAWNGSEALVDRAVRLIKSGALVDGTLEQLSHKMSISSRYLRKLFKNHFGVPPSVYAKSLKVGFAARLLAETELSITEVAHAAGFNSIRRFNDTFKSIYRLPPGEMRRSKKSGCKNGQGFNFYLKLNYRPPFDYAGILEFLANRTIKGLDMVIGDSYFRTVSVGDCSGYIKISQPNSNKDYLIMEARLNRADHLRTIITRSRKMFDLDANPIAIEQTLSIDKRLKRLIEKNPGIRLPCTWHPFEAALRAIVGQQISVKAASTIMDRIITKFGRPTTFEGPEQLKYFFPEPADLAREDLSGVGLTMTRQKTIADFCRALDADKLKLQVNASLDGFITDFTTLSGIGPWTANYVAMRGLGEPDAFPVSDLGIIRALAENGNRPKLQEIEKIAEQWRPWRAYAAMLLWQS